MEPDYFGKMVIAFVICDLRIESRPFVLFVAVQTANDATPCGSHAFVQGIVHSLVRSKDQPNILLLFEILQRAVGASTIHEDMFIALALKGMPDGANTQIDPSDRVKNRCNDRNIH